MSGPWIALDYDQPGLSPPRSRGSRRWLPQQAWLDGVVLVVERGRDVRQCDLASASEVTLRVGRLDGFLVLRACAGESGAPAVSLAIRFQRRQQLLIRPDALRLLAEAIGSRPGSPTHVARELRGLADTEERRQPPVDWTLRTSPEGWRWSSGPGPQ
jgi:hypothetical protein